MPWIKQPAFLIALLLTCAAALLFGYRILWLGYPIVPARRAKTYEVTVEGLIQTTPHEAVRAQIALPHDHGGTGIIDERIVSRGLEFEVVHQGPDRVGVWSGTPEGSPVSIGYRAKVASFRRRTSRESPREVKDSLVDLTVEETRAIASLASRWIGLSNRDRIRAVAQTARDEWGTPSPPRDDLLTWKRIQQNHGKLIAMVALLRAADIKARRSEGLPLSDGIQATTIDWIEVWDGKRWKHLRLETGDINHQPGSTLHLATDGLQAVRIEGGKFLSVRWTVSRQAISGWIVYADRIKRSDHWLDRWSLFHLPPEFQETFRLLLLVPMCALILSLLRNVVGFSTFGIFLPVLMALAFRSTGLAYGLGIFAFVISIGYALRRVTNGLRLLLIPRLSMILTGVIACLTIFALVGNQLDIREFMAVGLFPFVILTMTIERFFITVEEAGVAEGMYKSIGTAAVATITYEIIHWEPLQLNFFLYPELLLVVAALQILLGKYLGLRISELFRFRALMREA